MIAKEWQLMNDDQKRAFLVQRGISLEALAQGLSGSQTHQTPQCTNQNTPQLDNSEKNNRMPFVIFYNEFVQRIKQEQQNGTIPETELKRIAAEQWQKMNLTQRQPYIQKAEQNIKQNDRANMQMKIKQQLDQQMQNSNGQLLANQQYNHQPNQLINPELGVPDKTKREMKTQLEARTLFSQQFKNIIVQSFPQITLEQLATITYVGWTKADPKIKAHFIRQASILIEEKKVRKEQSANGAMVINGVIKQKKLKNGGLMQGVPFNLMSPIMPNMYQPQPNQGQGGGFTQEDINKLLQIYAQNQLICSQLLLQAQKFNV